MPRVLLIGLPHHGTPPSVQPSDADGALVYEHLDAATDLPERLLTATTDPDFHAALCSPLHTDYLPSCDDLSPAARICGLVDLIVRHGNGRLYGDFVQAAAIGALLRSEGAGTVRTALVLGSGALARAAVYALKDLGCARYVIGGRNEKQLAALERQFAPLSRQLMLFPLAEMADFFAWAQASGSFASEHVPPTETGGAERALDKGAKRWELVLNTSGDGLIFTSQTPTANHNFISTVNRVLDLRSIGEPSALVQLARRFGVPAYTGDRLAALHLEQAALLWQRVLRGDPLTLAAEPRRDRQRYVMKRRRK